MNQTNKKVKKGYSLIKFGLRFLLILVLLFIGLTVYLYSQWDLLEEYLVEYVDQTHSGKLSLDEINFSPFANFPHISLNIENIAYYSEKSNSNTQRQPLLKIESAILSFDLKELLRNKLSVKEIIIKNGSINYIVVRDSIDKKKSKETIVEDSTNTAMNFDINLQELSIQNIHFNLVDTNYHFISSAFINK